MLKQLSFLLVTLAATHNFLTASLTDLQVDFHESMCTHGGHDLPYALKDPDWQLGEALYNTHILNHLEYVEVPKIPKIIHHIWLGSRLPEYAAEFRQTWIQHHPDWIFIYWTDQPSTFYGDVILKTFDELINYLKQPNHSNFIVMNVNKVKLKNKQIYKEKARNYGEKSDILRYEILNEIGGLYVDTDFKCLQPFDEFHHCLDFYTGIADVKDFGLYNGLIASATNSPILKKAIHSMKKNNHRFGSIGFSGPRHFTKCFLESIQSHENDELAIVAFPVTFFYPWPSKFKDYKVTDPDAWVRPESYGLHYWKGAWDKPYSVQ